MFRPNPNLSHIDSVIWNIRTLYVRQYGVLAYTSELQQFSKPFQTLLVENDDTPDLMALHVRPYLTNWKNLSRLHPKRISPNMQRTVAGIPGKMHSCIFR